MNHSLRSYGANRGGVWSKLLWVVAVGLVIAVTTWVWFLPAIITTTVRAKTGFEVRVDALSINPFTAKVALSGLVLKNPAEWPAAEFVELREFRANLDLFSLFGERWEADEVVVDVAQLTLVRNRDGVLNVTAFKDGFAERGAPANKKSGPAPRFLIRRLSLKFDKLVYVDHSKGERPEVRDFDVNLRRELRDVDSVAKIVDPFRGTLVLGVLTDTLMGLFKDSPDLLKDLTGAIQDAGKKTGEVLKGLLQSLEKKKS